ncbi:MAG TPA: putative aminohydrolase SsnA [Kiritimatiellae bacterium]|nr:putative aminohydrolase SsnA [Kiritimatiellia bacterium]
MAVKVERLLVCNGRVVAGGRSDGGRIISDGAVLTEGNRIIAVGTRRELRGKGRGAQEIDARGGVIMPGLVNAHMHLYSSLARGLAPLGPPPRNFPAVLRQLWWPLDAALDRSSLRASAEVALVECLRSGTTTVIDHHESQSFQKGSLKVLEQALRRTGVRGALCLGVSDRYGRGPEGLEENISWAARIAAREQGRQEPIKAMIGLHAAFTVEEATLKKAVQAAEELDLGLHLHVAEDLTDQRECRKKYGLSVVQRLARGGALGPRTLAVHGVHLSRQEIRLIAASGTNLVHNPQSNMNNAVGVCPVSRLLRKYVVVGLGTDGMTADMRQEARSALLLHKHASGNPSAFFEEACRLLLVNNPTLVRKVLGWKLGRLRPGYLADIIVLDYHPPTPFNRSTFMGHFLFGLIAAPVSTAVVNGVLRMADARVLGVDQKVLARRASEQASALWKRFRRGG